MKKMILRFHSFIDVITNSSTSVYVSCHSKSIEFAKELINSILKEAGSDKVAGDLFTFKVYKEDEDGDKKEIKNLENIESYNENTESYNNHYLEIIPKNNSKATIDLAEKFKTIFELNGMYN